MKMKPLSELNNINKSVKFDLMISDVVTEIENLCNDWFKKSFITGSECRFLNRNLCCDLDAQVNLRLSLH